MADYQLNAQYGKQTVVRDRNLGGLVAWSAYVGTLPIPADKPPAEWVQQRLVAERIPLNAALYVDRTINFFLMDPSTTDNIRDLMSPWNSAAREVELSGQLQDVIGTFMPRFAELDTTQAQVDAWYVQFGFAEPPPPSGF